MSSKGYTLLELLLVVALVAAIGSSVVAYYGQEVVTGAKRQTTQREMAEVKRAFLSFYADNAAVIDSGVCLPKTSTHLPTEAFCSTFTGSDVPAAWTAERPNRLYGRMEFFERFGLWPLMRPSICWADHQTSADFIVFPSYTGTSDYGWRGPYVSASRVVSCYLSNDGSLLVETNKNDVISATEPFFPQIGTNLDQEGKDFYRIIYFEHCWDASKAEETIYRRLILFASHTPGAYQNADSLLEFTGNRRKGRADGYPLVRETGCIRTEDTQRGLYFVELLNLDITVR